MLDPLDYDNRPYLDALSRKRRNAYFVVFTERVSLHFWRPLFWILFFFGLWMTALPALFGGTGQTISTLVFFGGFFYFLHKDILTFRLPDSTALDQRIEARNNLLRGHISALEDKISNPKKSLTRVLWGHFEQQILSTFTKLRSPHPRALLSKRDPYALRFLAVLMFITGLSVSGSQWSERITDGLLAVSPSFSVNKSSAVSLWITPPEYTNMAQIYLKGGEEFKEPIPIPQGSVLKLSMKSNLGFLFPPVFQNGNIRISPEYMGDGIYGLETPVHEGATLAIRHLFYASAMWKYNFIPDLPPEIGFATQKDKESEKTHEEKPKEKKEKYEIVSENQLRFPLWLKDDYGVESLSMHMNLDDVVMDKPLGKDFSDNRLIMSPPATEFKIDPSYDLSWHTWAGLPVVITFEAKDHIGQITASERLSLVLPERKFEHPVAKSLIKVRKSLAWNYKEDFSALAGDLESLLRASDFMNQDDVLYLAIKVAAARLQLVNDKPQEERTLAAQDIIKLLWMAAISVEDGDLALAMLELKEAQKNLETAMANPKTTDAEIARLMDELQEKMNNAFAEMQKEMQKRMANGEQIPQIPDDMMNNVISPDAMAKMMEQLQSAIKSGDKAGAQEMLSQIQRMMDMMDSSTMTMQLPSDMQMMQDGVNELEELIKKQQALLEQTSEQAEHAEMNTPAPAIAPDLETLKDMGMENMPPPPQPNSNSMTSASESHKAEQQALRYILGQLMMDAGEKLDEIPKNMGQAEQSMRGSEEALGEEDFHSSIPHQEETIKHLKEAQKDLSKQLSARMQMMVGMGLSGGQKYDPLGRPYGEDQQNGQAHGSDVKIPDESRRKRVEEILDLLRRRSGEFDRPDDELEYFRRLLRQF